MTTGGGMPADGGEAETLWRAAVAKVLKADGGLPDHKTYDGIQVAPLYRTDLPGSPQPLRARDAFGIVQRVDHPDVAQAKALALADLDGGATGLSLIFADADTARGFGLKAPVDQLDHLLDGIALDRIAIRCEGGAAMDLARSFATAARAEGLDPARIDVDFGLDPFGELARAGGLRRDWREEAEALARVHGQICGHGFLSPVFRADGRSYHEAGATPAQELASVLATGVASLRLLDERGIGPAVACAGLSHVLVADAELVPTVAKLRAFRRLWARIEEACGLPQRLARLHVETAWRMLTRRDPWTNMLRATISCAGAILGGADGVTVLPFTAALGLPDAAARRLARNTALILTEESHLLRVVDPVAGSGAFEALTEALCEEAWRLFQEIEGKGGFPEALLSGHWQSQIAEARQARQRDIAQGTLKVTGTSLYPLVGEARATVLAPAGPPEPRPRLALRCEPLASMRDAEPFERFRDRSDSWFETRRERPRVRVSVPVSAFERQALEIGGFEVALDGSGVAALELGPEDRLVEGCDLVTGLGRIWGRVAAS